MHNEEKLETIARQQMEKIESEKGKDVGFMNLLKTYPEKELYIKKELYGSPERVAKEISRKFQMTEGEFLLLEIDYYRGGPSKLIASSNKCFSDAITELHIAIIQECEKQGVFDSFGTLLFRHSGYWGMYSYGNSTSGWGDRGGGFG